MISSFQREGGPASPHDEINSFVVDEVVEVCGWMTNGEESDMSVLAIATPKVIDVEDDMSFIVIC